MTVQKSKFKLGDRVQIKDSPIKGMIKLVMKPDTLIKEYSYVVSGRADRPAIIATESNLKFDRSKLVM